MMTRKEIFKCFDYPCLNYRCSGIHYLSFNPKNGDVMYRCNSAGCNMQRGVQPHIRSALNKLLEANGVDPDIHVGEATKFSI